jgi:hypothetical protein
MDMMRNTQELMDASSTVNNQSIQQKIMLLRSRYKSTKDLHIYLTDHRKCSSNLNFFSL